MFQQLALVGIDVNLLKILTVCVDNIPDKLEFSMSCKSRTFHKNSLLSLHLMTERKRFK